MMYFPKMPYSIGVACDVPYLLWIGGESGLQ
jgi:hypothetical protein